jgi:hemoglobin/transferrin/lactoferrin receptor protein
MFLIFLVFCLAKPVLAEQPNESSPPPTSSEESPPDEAKPTAADEENSKEKVPYTDTITVTGKRFESTLLENPHAITVVGNEEIARSATSNVGDLLRGRPGLAGYNDCAWGVNPTLRGLKKEQIIVMTDGIRINSAQPVGAVASFVDLSQFERVEVVKGPASLLYGSGAMGGVVNFVPRKFPFSDTPQITGRLSVGASSVDEGYMGSGIFAFTSPRHVLELNLSGMHREDYKAPAGTQELTAYEQWSVASRYRFKVGENHKVGLGFENHRVPDVWYPGSARLHPAPPVGISTIHSPFQERTMFCAGYKGNFGGSGLNLNAYVQDVERHIFAYSELLEKDFVENVAPFTTIGGGAKYDVFLRDSHTLTFGLDLWDMAAKPQRTMNQPPPSDTVVEADPFQNGKLQAVGGFVQDDVRLGDWTVKLGIRYARVAGDADQGGMGPQATTENLDHTDNMFSWSAGTVYHQSKILNPYVNVALGYRAADMRERFERAIRGDGFLRIGNPQLDPEKNTTAEVGMKGSSNRWTYTFAGYYSWIEDFIAGRETGVVDPGTGFPIKQTENLAKVEIMGLELQLDSALGYHLHAYFLGSLQRGENKYDDEPMFEMPPAEGTLGLAYRPRFGWNAGLQWRFVARQDRVGTKFSSDREDPTPGFSTVDLRAGYRFSRDLEVYLGVKNIFDEEYHEHLTQGVTGTEIEAPGRNFYIGTMLGF